jgi:hypothetical protein
MSVASKPGYKQTEVCVIPEDWEVSPLETFTSFISYGFTNPMPTSDSGVYMVTAKDINGGRIQFATTRCTTEEWESWTPTACELDENNGCPAFLQAGNRQLVLPYPLRRLRLRLPFWKPSYNRCSMPQRLIPGIS